ncbi:MAG: DedA family protein [Deltaproteobacteria bacterium]|nr:DedA family protein [Deltaproteobacteria bacterium]MCL5792005.1 DedA family protein [Deltaproteobacteria bacterium]
MISGFFKVIAGIIISTISTFGYGGIIILMAIESACIPLPSEIILPFAGYLVFIQKFQLFYVAVAGAFGCVIGSIIAYAAGIYGGRPLIEKYGKYILISRHDLDMTDRWFNKHGNITVFTGRLLPVIRTFISLPAGISRMNFFKFIFYTFTGSLIWSFLIAWIGFKLGQKWDTLGPYFHRFDYLILAAGIVLFTMYLVRHIKHVTAD